jgi:hypothetical protein
MENNKEITEPTAWYTPMVLVFKKSGDERIRIDLRKLNAAKSERYILPTGLKEC